MDNVGFAHLAQGPDGSRAISKYESCKMAYKEPLDQLAGIQPAGVRDGSQAERELFTPDFDQTIARMNTNANR